MSVNGVFTGGMQTNYPLPQPKDDKRFTIGLMIDIAHRIEAAGYPPLTGLDIVRLQSALFDVIYEQAAS